MKKFWNWLDEKPADPEPTLTPEKPEEEQEKKEKAQVQENVLFLHGTIAEESWFDDDVTPKMFRDELDSHKGDVTVYINSPGGDCIAASEIYTMLMEHKGNVTVKIDGLAASAASVIAMAGTKVLMAPTSLMMIHNPATMVFGDHRDFKAAEEMLAQVKDSIIKAYDIKTNLGKDKISKMMDAETWMSVDKAMELGFVDGLICDECTEEKKKSSDMFHNFSFSQKAVATSLYTKLVAKYQPKKETPAEKQENDGLVSAEGLMERLNNSLIIK